MRTAQANTLLAVDLLARASLRGNEYAWPIADIPMVIDAARAANLVSIVGQLQFRLPDGGTLWKAIKQHTRFVAYSSPTRIVNNCGWVGMIWEPVKIFFK